LGVLVQTNFGGVLTMGGAPVGKELGRYAFQGGSGAGAGDGSCMIVVATDAPLDARDLGRLAARAVYGLARTGSSFSNGSGEFAIAFTTSPQLRVKFSETVARSRTVLPAEATSPLFEAALEATEEAVYNSLLRATTVKGKGTTVEAIPIDRVKEIFKKYGR
jgi:D-aminopeptidase